jgi:hypothetical protein
MLADGLGTEIGVVVRDSARGGASFVWVMVSGRSPTEGRGVGGGAEIGAVRATGITGSPGLDDVCAAAVWIPISSENPACGPAA